ncbi:hypothetical protein F2Q70_00044416 [Brassica cretica]|uniref:UBC core domain-containing protein n=1 Tax=Brassica cretica TaxID=69181 RepID=A0A8S9KKX4_BRACR|nr:hypothetical protein F2Q70_00044416 [Brassica cretica]
MIIRAPVMMIRDPAMTTLAPAMAIRALRELMANSSLPRRIIKETQRLLSEPAPGISASPSEDNMRYFNVMVLGPSQSPYEGNLFNYHVHPLV